jgi:hypothetical protein
LGFNLFAANHHGLVAIDIRPVAEASLGGDTYFIFPNFLEYNKVDL